MTLEKFLKEFVERNTIVRLVYKVRGGHKIVSGSWDDVGMEWEILKGEGIYKDYAEREVVGVASIAARGFYNEAVNIVIV